MNKNLEIISGQVDKLEGMHVMMGVINDTDLHRDVLSKIIDEIKTAIISETGENPWD